MFGSLILLLLLPLLLIMVALVGEANCRGFCGAQGDAY